MHEKIDAIKSRAKFQLSQDELIEFIKENNEALVNEDKVVIIDNGDYTGRSPKDRFIVESNFTNDVDWNDINQPISKEIFNNIGLS